MKSSDEMAKSLFERRDEYIISQKRKRRILLACTPVFAIAMCIMLVSSVSVYNNYKIKTIESKIYPVTADFDSVQRNSRIGALAYDYTDKAKHVGFMDYVFVGRVEKLVGTSYTDVSITDRKVSATPWTNYEITVLGNIKGELKTNITIPVKKLAGMDINYDYLTINEGDTMPKEGACYIFCTFVDEAGELYISCNDANIYLGNDCEDEIFKALSCDKRPETDSFVIDLIWDYIEADAKKDNSVKPDKVSYPINKEYIS